MTIFYFNNIITLKTAKYILYLFIFLFELF